MSRKRRQFDVLVVGARCAGAATALQLARAGLRVQMVDRASAGTDTMSTHAFMRTGVVMLDQLGVLNDVRRAGTPAVTRTDFDYGTHATTVDVRPAHGVTALYAPRRTVLDALLVAAAAAAGAEVVFDVAVTEVEHSGDDRVTGIAGRSRAGTRFRATAELIVGADGLASTVAEAVQAPVRQRGLHAGALWYTYVTGLRQSGYRMFFRPGAVAGITPTNDGASCVFTGMPSNEFAVPRRAERWTSLVERCAAIAPRLGEELREAECVAPIRGWRGHPGVRRRAFGAGWALVGDAGYYKDPLGTHGMSQALRDAQLLSQAVIDAAIDGQPLATHLSGYERTRDALSARMFAATDALASYDWGSARVEQLLRQLSAEMTKEAGVVAATDTGGSHAVRTA